MASTSLVSGNPALEKAQAGVDVGAPKYLEWYCAFSLMVTLIWLYLTILRLLAFLARNH
jgi:uncharacterized YccA/Bax inhibitor family protein